MNTKNALQTPKEPAPITALGTKSLSKKTSSNKRTTKTTGKKTTRKAVVKKAVAKTLTKKKVTAKKRKATAKKPLAAKTKKTVSKKVTPATTTATNKPVASATKTPSGKRPTIEVYRLAEPAPNQRYFVLANGKPVQHVAELAELLDNLEDHVFDHHVNPERNDFHNWVKDVFQDIELAKKMLGVTDKKHLQLVIYKHAANKAFNR